MLVFETATIHLTLYIKQLEYSYHHFVMPFNFFLHVLKKLQIPVTKASNSLLLNSQNRRAATLIQAHEVEFSEYAPTGKRRMRHARIIYVRARSAASIS